MSPEGPQDALSDGVEPERVPVPITSLASNPQNPRAAWKPDQIEPFRESLRRFGDLGGIVMNRTTGHLVGGHKRVEVFRDHPGAVVWKTDQPEDAQGTVAIGYVLIDEVRFAYREVQWSSEVEIAANLAANRWAADWEWAQVSAQLQELQASDAALLPFTGFPAYELGNLLAADWAPVEKGSLTEEKPESSDHPHTIHLSPDQYAVLQRAKAAIVASEGGEPDPALSDGRVIELVCAEFLSGVDRE